MRKILLFVAALLLLQIAYSQVYKGAKADAIAPGADVVRLKNYTKVPSFIHFNESVNLNIEKSLNYTKQFLNSDNLDFVHYQSQKNNDSEVTHRYKQTYSGIPVEFTAFLVQTKDNRVFALNGEILDNIEVNPLFSISEEQALSFALDYIDAELYMWESAGEEELIKEFKNDPTATYFPKGEKLIVPLDKSLESKEFRTAYKFNIYAKIPYQRKDVYVDAISGEVIYDMQLLHLSDEVGTAQTQYSGEQQINTEFTGGEYILYDHTRGNGIRTLNMEMGIDYDNAVEFVDADNNWNNVNAELDEYATDAQFATMSTYDYYLNVHSRNSIDGSGLRLWSFIHFNLVEYGYNSNVNAFWNGDWMTYGDGNPDNGTTPLTTVDICGHEITHGLTSYTCNLNYQDESGALNEAFSDIFGTAIEFYSVPTYADWTVGEDIGFSMRSLANPNATNKPDTYQGEYWVFGAEDYGGVHTNMSPLCYCFYLLCEGGSGTNDNGDSYSVTSVGIDKASDIMFRLQTVYLTPTSSYHDAWFYAMQVASDLYGACSDEVAAVGDGFYAIGVADSPYIDEVHAGFAALYTEACAPPFEVDFTNQSYNGDNFLWNFGDGTTSTQINPTHTYADFGSYEVSIEVDGSACGSAIETKTDYIVVDESIPCLTLVPTSGNQVLEVCSGLLYDAGGPLGNYSDNADGSITIYAPGASAIELSVLEFDVEAGTSSSCNFDYIAFYEGTNTSALLINSTEYCNTTGNPETITSVGEYVTIRFVSDAGLNMSGFKIQYDCVSTENPPTTYFLASKELTCHGLIDFEDESLNFPSSWLWSFGDGSTSDEENPSHQYFANGTYTVSLSSTNANGTNELVKEDYIVVDMPIAPVIDNIQACSNSNFDINLDIDGEAYWYENEGDQSSIHTGNYWDHPEVDETTTYYIREVYPGEELSVGETNSTSNGGYFGNSDYTHYLEFDVYSPVILNSVEVNAEGSGIRIIALRTSTASVITQRAVQIPDGVSRIDLNFEVPVGEDLQLTALGTADLFRSNEGLGLDYPYTIDDIISITNSSASTGPTDYYYYFYNWEITTPSCKSPYVSVNLIPEECSSNIIEDLLNSITIAPNPTNDMFKVYGLEMFKDYSIVVTDIAGKVINVEKNYNSEFVQINGLSQGTYFIKVITNEGHKVIKLIKN